ncbi:MAG: hypothetical protein JNK35_07510 [Phycisphaerae bacterium]|nr:hypothetical protein [Phycisphaerae bacterium]
MSVVRAIREAVRAYRQGRKVTRWERAGRPLPMPSAAKRRTLREYAQRFGVGVFVETGTHRGDTIAALLGACPRIVSIEIEPGKVRAARARFAGRAGVEILEGDSGTVLPTVLAGLDRPALFWLDAHYMGAGSGKADDQTPISGELAAILSHPVKGHVVVIDDARLFNGTDGYPTLEAVRQAIAKQRPDLHWEVSLDLIRITPWA